MGNDELRLRVRDLAEYQLRSIIRDHFPGLAQRMGQAEREALEMALIDHVDQRGDVERQRLSAIMDTYITPPALVKPNGKTSMPFTDANLATTVAAVSTKVDGMTETLRENQQRLRRIEDGLAPLAKFNIEDWYAMKTALTTMQTSMTMLHRQGQVLLTMVIGGAVTSVVVLASLVLLAVRHLI